MDKKQLRKIIDDYRHEDFAINVMLHEYEIKKRALKSRQKLVKRKINILNEKIHKSNFDSINWSCSDFDELDVLQ